MPGTTLPPAAAAPSDGASQASRRPSVLDPGSVRVDERGTRELLAFLRAYAAELNYYAEEDPDNPAGDWSGFIGPALDLDEAAAYAANPEAFTPERAAPYARPHFALLLAFLELLGQARQRMNTLTRRHLEFFYGDMLHMARKPARRDQVHVLAEPAAGMPVLRLPAGTALNAGKDSSGRDLVYRTDHELLSYPVRVAQLRSLRTVVRSTGIREASREVLSRGTREEAFMAMLQIALGQPMPGDPLPIDLDARPPLYPGRAPAQPRPLKVGFDTLVEAARLLTVARQGLGLSSFDDFRSLVRLKKMREDNDSADWAQINAYLENAGRQRNPAFKISPPDSPAFAANLSAALDLGVAPKKPLENLFDGLGEVETVDEAYAACVNRPREVEEFLRTALAPLALDDFKTLMLIKVLMDNQWAEINRLIDEAGQRQQPPRRLDAAALASRRFADKLQAAGLGYTAAPGYAFVGSFDDYAEAFVAVERYFHLSAENVVYLMSFAPPGGPPVSDEWTWSRVYDIVGEAHVEMLLARRRAALLRAATPPGAGTVDAVAALAAMLSLVCGERIAPADTVARLKQLKLADKDRLELLDIAEGRRPLPDWPAVARVLEVAQSNLENFQPPAPLKTEWRNLYAADDATAVPAPAAVDGGLAWKTFGRGELRRDRMPVPAARIGWALASPLLALNEGARTIELKLGFSAAAVDFDLAALLRLLAPSAARPWVAGFNPFKLELSTADGWLAPADITVSGADEAMSGGSFGGSGPEALRVLVFGCTLAAGDPAVTRLNLKAHGVDSDAPVLRLMLAPVWNEADACYLSSSYALLRRLRLRRLRLQVDAAGLVPTAMRNDESVLDARKPFEPFGMRPAPGSRLVLGHPEIVRKRLDSLSFTVQWMGVPPDLGAHYANYLVKPTNASFKARVALSDAGVLKDFAPALPLFDTQDATRTLTTRLAPPADQGRPETATSTAANPSAWTRHLVVELTGSDFQHGSHGAVALQRSLEMAAAIANKTPATIDPKSYQVNPPWTPKVRSLSLAYTASTEAELAAGGGALPAARIWHVHPFGFAEVQPDAVRPGRPLLPAFDFEGELFIGLAQVAAPQQVSLLFQLAEGSGNPDLEPQPVQWSYLSGGAWVAMDGSSVLDDATRGLVNSGIVKLALPPALPATRLPGHLYWVRAAIARAADSVCDTVAIHANAVLASHHDQGNAADHLATPLPAGSIQRPGLPVPGLARVTQPYTSFGGRMAEQDASFHVRVSERLRHRQRALAPWDFERLVLEHFPQVYKVKCLPADPLAHPREPGCVQLVVIPDIRRRLPFHPFEPKASAELIADIRQYLQGRMSPFASLKVGNAHYVRVKVRCGVRFVAGADETFCRRRLGEELNRFLSPWAYEEGADIVIGGSVYANSLIDFIDRRDYVDYIAEFKLFTSDDGENFSFVPLPEPGADGYRASARRPGDVLVAAREHQFDVISDVDYQAEDFSGIDYMRVELDFSVG